ncbi:MAG: WYL domain-containing protein [Calditrichaeota bacterium]|nr:MAG: WYL domain-containing protein [Calditrichota bacterium]
MNEIEYADFIYNQTFIAFDSETTGMWAPINRLVELSAVKFSLRLGEIGTFDSLINPEREIPEEVMEIHGITNDMVKDAPKTKPVLKKFVDFCPPDAILIAHNAPFDISFLGSSFNREKMSFGDNLIIDTIDVCKTYFPGLPSYSLLNLIKKFGFSQTQDHRALSDSRYVYYLFRKASEQFADISSLDQFIERFTIHRMSDITDEIASLPSEYSDINYAIDNKSRLEIDYYHPTRESNIRTIQPREVHKLGETYYIIAYCERVGSERTFRLDRIKEYKILAG